jgi:CO/xanthine dehydrogenase Mo-binding subunit
VWDEAPNNRKAPGGLASRREERREKDRHRRGEVRGRLRPGFPDLAEAKIVRSDIAHGVVTDIDTSAAEAMDDVYAVLTPDSPEVPDKAYTSAGQSYPEPSPWDLRVFRRTVRFLGDPIAAVVAEDGDIASKAARKLDVTYEEYDAVFDTAEPMEPDAPRIHDADDLRFRVRAVLFELEKRRYA